MQNNDAGLTRFYVGWEEYQRQLVEAVVPLTTEQLALSVAPGLNPLWYLAAHIAGTRISWFELLREVNEDPLLSEYMTWDEGEVDALQPRTAAELVAALKASWEMLAGCLARWTPGMLNEPFERRRNNGTRETCTRGWVLWHVLEHDLHHGGELSLTLGAHGLAGLDL
jgi:uncharacterized damage-inducible protein DinB